jgi:PAS domain S-box-containing protein
MGRREGRSQRLGASSQVLRVSRFSGRVAGGRLGNIPPQPNRDRSFQYFPIGNGAEGRAAGLLDLVDVTRSITVMNARVHDVPDHPTPDLETLLPFCLLENLADAVIAQTLDGIIASWNPAAERLFGYPAREIKGKPFSILLPPEPARELPGLLKKIERDQRIEGFDTLRVRKDGSSADASLALAPIKTASGQVIGALGIMRDIGRRKRVEAELWDSEEQFREMARHIRQAFWMIDDTETKVLYVSPAYEKVWGRTCQSFVDNPRSFLDAIHPLDRDRVIRANAQKHLTGEFEEEYRILGPDGSVRWIWDRSYPVHDAAGLVKAFAGIAEDITERRATEDDRARLAAIVEFSEDAIVSKTMEGIIISWNHGAERLYGYSAEEMIGRSTSVLFAPDHYQEYRRIMEKVRKGEPIPAYETVRRKKDGSSVNVSMGICPIEVRKGEITGASKIAHDITRMKRLEEQFRQAQKMEAVGRLAAGIAHDFNNMLAVVSTCSQALLEAVAVGDPRWDLIMAIKKAGERAASLTQQLLTLSRKQVLEPKDLDLNALVTASEKILRQLAGENIELVTVLDPTLGRGKTDLSQFDRVLMNLVANARDAMPQGGKLTITTAHAILDQAYCRFHREVNPGRYIVLAVSDTGCGMDEQTKAHIFEPFFTTKEPGKGTGLGLAMVHGFIKQSNGHVEVCSEPGLGTTFKVFIPEIDPALSVESTAGVLPQSAGDAGTTLPPGTQPPA